MKRHKHKTTKNEKRKTKESAMKTLKFTQKNTHHTQKSTHKTTCNKENHENCAMQNTKDKMSKPKQLK
jgi:hypothetical protein